MIYFLKMRLSHQYIYKFKQTGHSLHINVRKYVRKEGNTFSPKITYTRGQQDECMKIDKFAITT